MTKLRAAALTDIGRVRHENEDRYLLDEDRQIFGVADGVGGLPRGAEAAQAAHDSVMASFRAIPESVEFDLTAIVLQANRIVAELGRMISPATGIATTLTFGCVRGGFLQIAHVGDSRCYLSQGGQLSRLTEDHTVENEVRRHRAAGILSPYSAADGRAITRCIGNSIPPEVDLIVRALAPNDRYLFCTDGITGLVSDEEIAVIIAQDKKPAHILRELIGVAIQRGGTDNATAVLIIVDPA